MQTWDIALKTSWLGYKNNLVRKCDQLKHFDKSNLVKRKEEAKQLATK
jgi:hypothetical protein